MDRKHKVNIVQLTGWSKVIVHVVEGVGENTPVGEMELGNTRGPPTRDNNIIKP